ncbi:MAG: hypothetical protein HYY64_07170 [Candidatus Rokubacteria bacterium]|nr:hypothetical protein [Candidatus Rokubacteria bacterium]
MRVIDRALVDEVWREVTAYPPGRQAAEAEEFLERQPDAAAFCQAVTRELDVAVQRAAIGLAFLIFKIREASLGAPVPPLARSRIREAYEATTDWLERREEGGGEFPHRNLVQYLVEWVDADEEAKATLFLLLKTLSDALDTPHPASPQRGEEKR